MRTDLHYFDEIGNTANPVIDAVEEGMAPFRLKAIDVYLEEDLDYNRFRVLAGAVLKNGYTIGYTEYIDRDDLVFSPEHEFYGVANKMREAFRYRADYPIPPKIQLGEN